MSTEYVRGSAATIDRIEGVELVKQVGWEVR
jgi:hypothetical protein